MFLFLLFYSEGVAAPSPLAPFPEWNMHLFSVSCWRGRGGGKFWRQGGAARPALPPVQPTTLRMILRGPHWCEQLIFDRPVGPITPCPPSPEVTPFYGLWCLRGRGERVVEERQGWPPRLSSTQVIKPAGKRSSYSSQAVLRYILPGQHNLDVGIGVSVIFFDFVHKY